MPSYYVTWTIDIDTEFDSPREAAEKALAIQRDPESIATIFEVTDSETGEKTIYDLLDLDESELDLDESELEDSP